MNPQLKKKFTLKTIMSIHYQLVIFLAIFLLGYNSYSSEMTEEELEAWFNADDESPIQVDKGELVFLPNTDKKLLHSINELSITAESINTGWVKLTQCYKHLDAIDRTDIVYRYQAIRNLHITALENIQSAKININSIELKNVAKHASLCIAADVQILNKQDDNHYVIKNGPYHRRFLDGYFPFHVTLSIHYPESQMKVIKFSPSKESGLNLSFEKNKIIYDNVFAGQLTIETVFQRQ